MKVIFLILLPTAILVASCIKSQERVESKSSSGSPGAGDPQYNETLPGSGAQGRPTTQDEGIPGYIVKLKDLQFSNQGKVLRLTAPEGSFVNTEGKGGKIQVNYWVASDSEVAEVAEGSENSVSFSKTADGGFATNEDGSVDMELPAPSGNQTLILATKATQDKFAVSDPPVAEDALVGVPAIYKKVDATEVAPLFCQDPMTGIASGYLTHVDKISGNMMMMAVVEQMQGWAPGMMPQIPGGGSMTGSSNMQFSITAPPSTVIRKGGGSPAGLNIVVMGLTGAELKAIQDGTANRIPVLGVFLGSTQVQANGSFLFRSSGVDSATMNAIAWNLFTVMDTVPQGSGDLFVVQDAPVFGSGNKEVTSAYLLARQAPISFPLYNSQK